MNLTTKEIIMSDDIIKFNVRFLGYYGEVEVESETTAKTSSNQDEAVRIEVINHALDIYKALKETREIPPPPEN